jgi:hypothetical protein
MKKVLILNRDDMTKLTVLTAVDEVSLTDFGIVPTQQIEEFDMVLFFCRLTSQSKIIKNRGGAKTARAMEMKSYTSLTPSSEELICSKLTEK